MTADSPRGTLITVEAKVGIEFLGSTEATSKTQLETTSLRTASSHTPLCTGEFDFEAAYRKTGNKAYAWQAMYSARNSNPPQPIPEWCWPVLDRYLYKYHSMEKVLGDPAISDKEKLRKLVEALGLQLWGSGRRNSIRQKEREIAAAMDVASSPNRERPPERLPWTMIDTLSWAKGKMRRFERFMKWG
jgi:hypothetical protein